MLVGTLRGHVVAASIVGNALSTSTGNVYVVPHNQAYAGYLVALVSITLGVLVWERRPDSRTGTLLIAFPLAGVLADPIVFPGSRVAVTVGLAAALLGTVIAAHLILSYPTGRFTSRLDRGFVVFGYGFALVSALPFLLFFDPRAPHDRDVGECYSCALPLTHVAWHDVTGVRHVLNGVGVVLILFFIALLLRKIVRAVPVARSVALPLAVVAFVGAARFASLLGLRLVAPSSNASWNSAWDWSAMFVTLAISLALAAGMLWGGAGRGAVADLVVALERTPPGSVRDALARALGDPSLELALWLPERRAYVDHGGAAARASGDRIGSGGDRARSDRRSGRGARARPGAARAAEAAPGVGRGGAAGARERAAAGRAAAAAGGDARVARPHRVRRRRGAPAA
jgi:hypothetical protein